MQDQTHLIGIGRAARSAITGQLGLVQLDQIFGLTACAVECIIDVFGRAFGQRSYDIADIQALS